MRPGTGRSGGSASQYSLKVCRGGGLSSCHRACMDFLVVAAGKLGRLSKLNSAVCGGAPSALQVPEGWICKHLAMQSLKGFQSKWQLLIWSDCPMRPMLPRGLCFRLAVFRHCSPAEALARGHIACRVLLCRQCRTLDSLHSLVPGTGRVS